MIKFPAFSFIDPLAWRLRTMSKKSKSKKASPKDDQNERVIAQNRKARHKYNVVDTLECGILLVGSEVKSMRQGHISIAEAYGRVQNGEVWLIGCNIDEYKQASRFNHEAKRPRKLLLHRREIERFANQAKEKGLTLVPLKMYFKGGLAKVLMGICRGKKTHDKREAMKKADTQRGLDRLRRGR